jgi:hypothetical protein
MDARISDEPLRIQSKGLVRRRPHIDAFIEGWHQSILQRREEQASLLALRAKASSAATLPGLDRLRNCHDNNGSGSDVYRNLVS